MCKLCTKMTAVHKLETFLFTHGTSTAQACEMGHTCAVLVHTCEQGSFQVANNFALLSFLQS